jgi:hypothetical protein
MEVLLHGKPLTANISFQQIYNLNGLAVTNF